MKKNDYLLLAATASYSFLFYEQSAGLNFLLFNLILIGIFLIRDTKLLRQGKWLWAAGLCVVSSAGIFINSSLLSIIANCISLLILSGVSMVPSSSFIFSLLISVYSVVASGVWMIIDAVTRAQASTRPEGQKNRGLFRILTIAIVLVLCIIFFLLYRASNPLFAENTKWLNFDFLSIAWIGFTLLGLLVTYGLLYHKAVPEFSEWENALPVQNGPSTDEERGSRRLEIEGFGGILLFVMLNLMLVVLNVGDVQTLFLHGGLPKGISHSDFVHDGVNAMIFSILLATGLLMYMFRKNFSALRSNRFVKALVYLWVLQNILMLVSTMMRNQIYVHDCNLTYKRIGVFVWLGLAAIGLFLTFFKVYKERSNWFLVYTNFSVWISVLAFSSLINWDVYLTRFNLANKPTLQVDFVYLFELSDANLPELMEMTTKKEFRLLNQYVKVNPNPYNRQSYDYYYANRSYQEMLVQKISHYINHHYGDWRSLDLQHTRILHSITAQPH